MKIIGLIGGMSWESTLWYYRIVNEIISEKCGGLHSAKCIIYSVDFEEIKTLMDQDRWQEITWAMIDPAQKLEAAGADAVLICTNTIHNIADDVQNEIGIPLLHIADATGETIEKQGIKKIGLLGTRYTMEHNFYSYKLLDYGIKTVIPNEDERRLIDDIIFNELCLGKIERSSKNRLDEIINDLIDFGAEGIVLGCTELHMLVESAGVPLFDTTRIHAKAAVEFALTNHRFVGQPGLFLETADQHIFTHPYYFEDAIGKIFKIIPGGAGPEDAEHDLGYIKHIFPSLPGRIVRQPIIIVKQIKSQEENLVLTAIMNSKKIKIVLCKDEA